MGKLTFWTFVSEQWARLPPPLQADLNGKTVLVIGANTGIGLEAAKHFAKMKPSRLIIGCRSEGRGRVALEGDSLVTNLCIILILYIAIASSAGYTAELRLIDLANFASVRSFVSALQGDPVDIVVANAAVAQNTCVFTDDEWEQS